MSFNSLRCVRHLFGGVSCLDVELRQTNVKKNSKSIQLSVVLDNSYSIHLLVSRWHNMWGKLQPKVLCTRKVHQC